MRVAFSLPNGDGGFSMKLDIFLSLPSWSVNYNGCAYDDARHGEDGVWHYRDIITREILRFALQDRVIVICKNEFANLCTLR
jgi:hypothetical protein